MVNLLIAVTGSVATIRLVDLIEEFTSQSGPLDIEMRVIASEKSLHFTPKDEISRYAQVFTDEDEWASWKKLGDPVLHIELRKWADILLVAPLDANTLAKIANGLCDNLITSVIRAWQVSKPIYLAPAMNTHMWTHPITQEHLDKISSFGYLVIPPISKKLACADVGIGAMANYQDICKILLDRISTIEKSKD